MVLSHAFPSAGSLDIRHSVDKTKMKGCSTGALGTLPSHTRVPALQRFGAFVVRLLVTIFLPLYPSFCWHCVWSQG